MSKPPRENVVPIPAGKVLGPLMKRIRAIAEKSEQVFLSPHAHKQMAKRGLTDVEVLRALKLGEIAGVPWHEPKIGGQACKVVFRPRGSRAMGVVTVVLQSEEMLVKTVEWEDER